MQVYSYKTVLDGNRPVLRETSEQYYVDGRSYIRTPQSIYEFATESLQLNKEAEEHVYVLCLNTKGKLIGVFEASHGGYDLALFPVREIFAKALMLGASRIAVVHNHPSGDPTPSREDDEATKRMAQAGKLLDLNLVDHVVVGSGYFSYREKKGELV